MINPNTPNQIAAAYEKRLSAMREQLEEAKKDAERWRLFVELFRAVERQRNIDVLQGISSGIRSEAKCAPPIDQSMKEE